MGHGASIKSLISVKEFDGLQQVKDIKMVDTSFWIRVFDQPLMTQNEYIKCLIGNALRRFEEVNLDHGEVEWGEFMHIRANLDITKPLLRKKKLNIGLPKVVWLNFKYDRLPDFCFCYRVLSHNHKDCKIWKATPKNYEKEGLPYGNSLRVGFNEGS